MTGRQRWLLSGVGGPERNDCDLAAAPFDPAALPWGSFAAAADSRDYACDLTHPLYRYPARMSPQLARAVILGLTEPGDLVLDPFSGGGTTAIEALSNGRRVVCCDLNALGCFVTRAKAWPVGPDSLRAYQRWAVSVVSGVLDSSDRSMPLVANGGVKYAPRTHGALLELRDAALGVNDPSARRLALLTVLRTGQLCFDCRRTPPSPSILKNSFRSVAQMVLHRMQMYSAACRRHQWPDGLRRSLRVLRGDADDIPQKLRASSMERVSLILTSPPYPGVHVLYHRWQIYGRRETALPYHLLHLNDGYFESHYTFGSRKQHDKVYFCRLISLFSSLRRLVTPATLVVQVVGFADPECHLSRFREAMRSAGFEEVIAPDLPASAIARIVPHRRWYAELAKIHAERREFLLVHRPEQMRMGYRNQRVASQREGCINDLSKP